MKRLLLISLLCITAGCSPSSSAPMTENELLRERAKLKGELMTAHGDGSEMRPYTEEERAVIKQRIEAIEAKIAELDRLIEAEKARTEF